MGGRFVMVSAPVIETDGGPEVARGDAGGVGVDVFSVLCVIPNLKLMKGLPLVRIEARAL